MIYIKYLRLSITALCLFGTTITVSRSYAQTRILFDATKGEMAGNADWVIDADVWNVGVGSGGAYIAGSAHKSNPQRVPTPAQGGITSATPETYWSGGISAWAVDCAKKGYTVETLPWNGEISYGNTSNPQDLANYKIFVIDEPNLKFITAEKVAILQFVQNGGSLFVIADHDNSDRNGDGWDSPHIWNDFFADNTITNNPFGITFDYTDFSQTTTNISAAATDPVIHGSMGNVTQAKWAGGTTMTLNPAKNSSIKGVIFKSGTTPGNSNAMVAYGTYGGGKIAAMSDSSPTDDGTGNPDCTLYNGYFDDAAGNHQLLIMNITIWLASATTAVTDAAAHQSFLSLFPNPTSATDGASLVVDRELNNCTLSIYSVAGQLVQTSNIPSMHPQEVYHISAAAGSYLVRVTSDETTMVLKLHIN